MNAIHIHRRRVAAAIRFVRQSGEGSLRLDEMALAAGTSPFHFDRIFRRMTGMGAIRYARWFRLRQAAVQLVHSDRSVIDIALSAGYTNHESFSRAFRIEFKISPRSYRSKSKLVTAHSKEFTMKDLGVSLGFVKIPVSDFARSTAFYREVLGLGEDFAVEQYGWAQYDVGGTAICIYVTALGGGGAKPGIDTGIQLRVTNAKAAYVLVKTRGGKLGELNLGDDGTVGFDVYDPDGNKLAVAQVPVDPAT